MSEEEMRAQARALSAEVLRRLFELAMDHDATDVQVLACCEILDRAWGKAAEDNQGLGNP
jgi:hypothetical protein